MTLNWPVTVAVLSLGLCAAPAAAGTFLDDLQSSSGLTVTVGVEGHASPKFEGSDRYEFYPVPLFDLRPAGTAPRFHAPRDGIGFTVFQWQGWDFGPVGAAEYERHMKSDPMLRLDDTKLAIEVGGFAEHWFTDWLRYRLELRKGVSGHHGVVLDQFVDFLKPLSDQWLLSAGPRMRISDSSGNGRFFNITTDQSLATGLPVYHADAGIRSVGAGVQLLYRWSPQWEVHTFVEYDRLVSSAGDSPLVTARGSADQVTIGAGFAYSFDIGGKK